MFTVDMFFGYRRLVTTQEIVGSKIRMGGYSILYDRNGNEVSRTPNTWNCEVECWTSKEAKRLAEQANAGES